MQQGIVIVYVAGIVLIASVEVIGQRDDGLQRALEVEELVLLHVGALEAYAL